MQAPGGPDEDRTGGFEYGGWTAPYFDDAAGQVMDKQMSMPFDLLLGRKTYDIFAGYWPNQAADNPIRVVFDKATKYVVTRQPDFQGSWDKTVVVSGDNVVEQIKQLKAEDGPMLQVHGSGDLVQTLLAADLVDELWLKIFPVTLGSGKRLFESGSIPAAFKVTETSVTPTGIIVANYERAGDVQTGDLT